MSAFRELELLVARIESALVPTGAIVKSPDIINDLITGEPREIDVSIRYKLGSVELLVTVECRDRVKTEDVTWIEQLATKQKHVGASHTVAVSSTGFSAPAVRAAQHHGISIRTIADVTDADILAWVDTLEVETVDATYKLGRLMLEYDGVHEGVHIDAASESRWTRDGWDAVIFVDEDNGATISLADLITRAVTKDPSQLHRGDCVSLVLPPGASTSISDDPLHVIVRDLAEEGSPIQKVCWLTFEGTHIAVGTNRGLLRLRKLGFEVTVTSVRQRISASRIVSYSDQRRAIAHVAERSVQLGAAGRRFIITQHRDVE